MLCDIHAYCFPSIHYMFSHILKISLFIKFILPIFVSVCFFISICVLSLRFTRVMKPLWICVVLVLRVQHVSKSIGLSHRGQDPTVYCQIFRERMLADRETSLACLSLSGLNVIQLSTLTNSYESYCLCMWVFVYVCPWLYWLVYNVPSKYLLSAHSCSAISAVWCHFYPQLKGENKK